MLYLFLVHNTSYAGISKFKMKLSTDDKAIFTLNYIIFKRYAFELFGILSQTCESLAS